MEIQIKNTWNDVSIREYQYIMEVIENKDLSLEAKNNEILCILSGLDYATILKLPVSEYKKIYEKCEFLQKEIPHKPIKKNIKILNKNFNVVIKLSEVKTGQFLDLQELIKNESEYKNLHKITSLFILPEGKEYGDFDIEAHQEFLLDHLSIVDAYSVFFYLHNLSLKFARVFHKYFKKVKKTMEKK